MVARVAEVVVPSLADMVVVKAVVVKEVARAVTLAGAAVPVARVAEVAVPCLADMVAVSAAAARAVMAALAALAVDLAVARGAVALPRTTCASLR